MKSKVAVYTSTRAEYGLMRPLVMRLAQLEHIDTRLFVTGTHFSEQFGLTINEIRSDFPNLIYYQVVHSIEEDSVYKNTMIMGEALQKYSKALADDRPDVAIVLGDRYEALCFGLACASLNIPLIHLHGGELTFGAVDDKYRHCLTKLAEWHFVACEKYRERVIQLGEPPANVYNLGSLGVDNALNLQLRTKSDLEQILKIELPEEFYILTFHPETNSKDYGQRLLTDFLAKVEARLKSSSAKLIVTGVNNDHGAMNVKRILQSFVQKNQDRSHYFESLGVLNYLSMVAHATAVLGNSSSGVLEAHSLKTPAINIGSRQAGRERESSLLDFLTSESIESIDFEELLNLKRQLVSKPTRSIFGDGATAQKMAECIVQICNVLKSSDLPPKVFHDL